MMYVESMIPEIHSRDVAVRINALSSLREMAQRVDLSPVVMDLAMHLDDASKEVSDLALGTLIIYARGTKNIDLLGRMREVVSHTSPLHQKQP
jgi:hypothetical protein